MEQLKQEQDELEARRKAEEAYAADVEKQEALEKRIENSRYPMVTAEFGGDFTDRQLAMLHFQVCRPERSRLRIGMSGRLIISHIIKRQWMPRRTIPVQVPITVYGIC